MQFAQGSRNVGLLRGRSQHTRALGPTCAADVGQTPHSTGASATKLPSHGSMRVFNVSCLMNTLIGKAFEDVGRIENNVTQQLLQMQEAYYRR
jgi:hypothetical protein